MKYTLLRGVMFVLVLLITACATPVTGVAPSFTVPAATAAEPSVTKSSLATKMPEVEAYPGIVPTRTATATSTASVPVTGGTTVKATLSDSHGLILANADGFTLYLYKEDTQNGDSSACTEEECTADWIPFTTEGSPVADAGAIQKLLGMITREDGRTQVTYNGWPLYLYSGDNAAGSVNGQGLEGEWFLVSPAGTAIQK